MDFNVHHSEKFAVTMDDSSHTWRPWLKDASSSSVSVSVSSSNNAAQNDLDLSFLWKYPPSDVLPASNKASGTSRGLSTFSEISEKSVRNNRIIIKGFSDTTTERHLKEYFKQFGSLSEAKIQFSSEKENSRKRSKGYAVVIFHNEVRSCCRI